MELSDSSDHPWAHFMTVIYDSSHEWNIAEELECL